MHFYLVDVFAEQKYQGNQLAVLMPRMAIDTAEMQRIAKEINFSESSFIVPDKKNNGGYDVRIFTPDVEIPFAGHPTLGTAFIIHSVLEESKSNQVILNLPIGQIPVVVSGNEFIMKQNEPVFGDKVQPEIIAEILNIDIAEIDDNFPVQVVSTGLPAIIAPIKSLSGIKKCSINHERFKAFIRQITKANILVYTKETQNEDNQLHVRVFMDDPGFLEDAATGSANGNLAGYLLKYNVFNASEIKLQVEQGYQIGRYSLIKILASKINEKYNINIAGKVILVASGEWL